MYTATLVNIAKNALIWQAEERLGYQTNPGEACHYRYDDGSGCVIGADLPDQLAQNIRNDYYFIEPSIDELISSGLIKIIDDYIVDSPLGLGDSGWMSLTLQYMHDALAGVPRNAMSIEDQFLELLRALARGDRPMVVTF